MNDLEPLLKQLLAKRLGENASNLTIIASSRDNTIFRNKTDNSIARISLIKSQEDVQQEILLLNYLKNSGFPCPAVITSGYVEYEKRKLPYIIFEYVDHDKNTTPKNITENHVTLAARAMASLHRLTMRYCQDYGYKQNRALNQDLIELREFIKKDTRSQATNVHEILEDLEWAINFFSSQKSESEHMLVLHNDFRVNNVLFSQANNLVSIIDFDWSLQSSFTLKDLGHGALEWSYPDNSTLNLKYYERFINEYWNGNPPVKQVSERTVRQWSKFSALSDAAHYFLSFPERTKMKFDSYMYDKYLHLKDNEN